MVGMPKRPEIKPADFAKALEDQPVAIIRSETGMGMTGTKGLWIHPVTGAEAAAFRARRRSPRC